ncbi:Flagellar basal-body rod protein FlgG [Pseudovibrio axinellae]|uniref:Flagellar basal-body rod protein FlgF n=1 Tax=Pseudovibrio axinellae TaxID=989403 RepID=A0A161XCA7_9HYPH|nr:flagellar basal-body rod protein FlgF [Pseudovibrio axinellae]KZL08468.1 Flagellar basal-body rod protein FlgG [Pseudovibrio axinellae]SEP74973.1 flagellar basal-body rod protein FlgF [Pseudovibrio axinellae]
MVVSSLYVSLSGQMALERRLETVARNVANMETTGYRADEVKFDSLVKRPGEDPVAFASTGKTYISTQPGEIKQTGNTLDVAIEGEGWLGIQTGNGIAYTRDGRFQVATDGILRSIEGNPILDNGNAPIVLDPLGGSPEISKDGTIYQEGRQVGVLGLFSIPQNAQLSRTGNSGVIPDTLVEPVQDFTENGFAQGFAEGSNINPIAEITKLITITRAFESTNSMMQSVESIRQQTIKKLGEG